MMKTFCLLLLTVFSLPLFAQSGDEDKDMLNAAKARDQKAIDEALNGWWKESMKDHSHRIGWWREAKFGMFVHWGIYSLPGGEWNGHKVPGYAEHLMRKEKISRAGYLDLAHKFNPEKFDADEWIRTARDAGMRYFIITAKHHDGFAMFESDVSDFNIIKQTPFGRDPMAALAQACRKYQVKFGFYYSHAFDWEHPDAPGNDWEYENPGGDRNLFGGRNWYDQHPDLLVRMKKYVDQKAIPQITELLQKYRPDILWFDTPHKLPLSENIRILKAIREIDNNVVVNGRLARTQAVSFGDYRNTADRPAEFYPVEGDWEAIPTTNESYGYHKFDSSHKSPGHFIRLMANAAGRGGNLLMNIGPKGDGALDVADVQILKGIGKWFDINSESIYGSSASPLPLQSWGTSTLKNNKLYLHVFDWPRDNRLLIGGLKSEAGKAWLLADPSRKELRIKRVNDLDVAIELPRTPVDAANSVVVVELVEEIAADPVRLISGEIPERLLAFDAIQHGDGFRFGDGKKDKYFVEGWSATSQLLSWSFRVNQPIIFAVRLKYIPEPGGGGTADIKVNGKNVCDQITISDRGEGAVVREVGSFSITGGTHSIAIVPKSIKGPALMKLLEIELVPANDRGENKNQNSNR